MNALAERAPALVIAADATLGERCAAVLTELGFAPRSVTTPSTALEQFHDARPHVVVLELDRPDAWGDHLLRQIGEHHQTTPVLVLAPAPDLKLACAAGRAGAHEVLDRAAPADEIRAAIQRLMPEATDGVYPVDRDRAAFFAMYEQIFHGSEKMRQIEQLVLRVAETRHGLLIQGERGVGKELVGRAVHHLATPAGAPWVAMNCAALPAEILEVELFGRDPATGDEGARPGRLEQGQGGTLLLKEIAEVPPSLQVKLLRLLDDGEFYRVNGRELHRADLRIIVTAQQPLPSLVAAGSFRADLYQRLQAMSLTVPPLRERREELEPLQKHFRQRFARDFGRPSPPLSRATMDLLLAYAWPGNVQELEDLMKRYVVLGDEEQLRSEVQTRMRAVRPPVAPLATVPALSALLEGASTGDLRAIARQAAQQAERAAITRVLQEVQWNRAEAARRLRISYKTLLTKLAQADFGKKLRTRGGP